MDCSTAQPAVGPARPCLAAAGAIGPGLLLLCEDAISLRLEASDLFGYAVGVLFGALAGSLVLMLLHLLRGLPLLTPVG